MSDIDPKRPPRENLIRGLAPDYQAMRAQDADDDGPAVLHGRFAVFNTWTEINSIWEGRFMERVAPGAFKKTMNEGRSQMRVLLEHGHDPQLGNKPIAAITDLREDDEGAYYEAELFAGLPPLVMDGLRAGQYGASFRFRVLREEFDQEPEKSEHNPEGLPERTIKEAEVREFGPVTWGAYPEATAAVRSFTDEFVIDRLARDPERLLQLVDARRERIAAEAAAPVVEDVAPSDDAVAESTEPERREEEVPTPDATEAPPVEGTPKVAKRDYLHDGPVAPSWLIP